METIEQVHAHARDQLDALNVPFLDDLEEATGVDKVMLVLLSLILVYMIFIGGIGAGIVCTSVGFAYPGYASFRALQKPAIIRAGEVRLWLMFWIVFACFKFVEVFADKTLAWIPNYNTFKFCAILTLFVPSTSRATSFYQRVLVPFIKPNESDVDKFAREVQFEADRVAANVYDTALFRGILGLFKSTKRD